MPDDLNSPYHDFGFHTMIMQHCIISSYHAILTELLNNQTLSSYSVENKIKNRGFFDLYKKGAISISENDVTFHELNKDSIPKNRLKPLLLMALLEHI